MGCEGLIDDKCVLISLIACSMNPETAVTFTRGHFNRVVFAVIYIYSCVALSNLVCLQRDAKLTEVPECFLGLNTF